MLIGSPVPKETMAKEDAKVTLTYRLTGLTSDSAQLKIIPGASSLSPRRIRTVTFLRERITVSR